VPWRRRRVTQVDHTPPPPRRPLLWPWLLLLLLLVGTGIGLAYFLTRDDDESSSDRVPAVVGLREADAVERLRADGYPADIRRAVNPAQVGKVIRQIPSAGTGQEPGKTVVIIVARRPNTVDVPRVVGLDVAEAFERVQAAGLRARSMELFARQAKGRVIRQRPPAGAEARRGELVVLTISKGPQHVAVPPVIGLTEAGATTALRRVGLRIKIARVAAREPDGVVVAQNPTGSARAPKGSTVRLNISTGPPAGGSTQTVPTTEQATVPDVVGETEAAATRILRNAGFTVRVVDRPVTDPTQDGLVVEQAPQAGTRVQGSTQVTIYVGRLS
jgi:eukaryotic-like serine/threonine-protein kinase